jgi:hypothetical protein
MSRTWKAGAIILISCLTLTLHPLFGIGPQPGDVYREYTANMAVKDNWRVTDPNAGHQGAGEFLPNAVLNLNISDLDGAVRAEAVIDRWGGHAGTSGKRIRFNGNEWLPLPELETTPEGERPECYMYQDNPIIAIPLEHLKEGPNTFEGICGDQVCFSFNWGQWGWYSLILRIYYNKNRRHSVGGIVLPLEGEKFEDFPSVKVEATSPRGVSRVDIIGYYEAFDMDGDGVFSEWQRYYQGTSLTNNIGSALSEPWEVTWNTEWVPDQEEGSIKLIARIRDNAGIWFVTDEVRNLSLIRDTVSVKMYKPESVPQRFTVRINREMSCEVNIPGSESLDQATEATVHLRTWNGIEDNFVLNDSYSSPIGGNNHFFGYSIREIPVSVVVNGANKISFTSPTEHHGPEILWPGPVIMVRFKGFGSK